MEYMSEEEKEARYLINVLEDKKFTAQGEALRTYIEELNKNINKLQKENKELKKEIDNLIKENHKHIDYIASMKKKQEDKIRTEIKELEEILEKRKTIDIVEEINRLEELLGDDEQ